MIAALLCGIVGLTLALLLPGSASTAALPFAFLGLWLWLGGGERWLARRNRRRAAP